MTETTYPSFAVVGLGPLGGATILRYAVEHGFRLVGAVDVGEKVGRPLREIVSGTVPDLTVSGDIAEVLATEHPDIVVITAKIGAEKVTDLAVPLLERGINVLTLELPLFEGTGPLADRLDAAGKQGGASFIATGIQDWWVHIPATAAAFNNDITGIVYDDVSDLSEFSEAVGVYEGGIGLDDAAFEEWRQQFLRELPLQLGPMREIARLFGLTPGEATNDIVALREDSDRPWPGADRLMPAGSVIGALFSSTFVTEEGVTFEGRLDFRLLDGPEHSLQTITVRGDAEMVMKFPAINAPVAYNMALVRRMDDIVGAPPGVVRVRELPPARYRPTVS